jgi:uncharacterized small protein (DUF1192 family)
MKDFQEASASKIAEALALSEANLEVSKVQVAEVNEKLAKSEAECALKVAEVEAKNSELEAANVGLATLRSLEGVWKADKELWDTEKTGMEVRLEDMRKLLSVEEASKKKLQDKIAKLKNDVRAQRKAAVEEFKAGPIFEEIVDERALDYLDFGAFNVVRALSVRGKIDLDDPDLIGLLTKDGLDAEFWPGHAKVPFFPAQVKANLVLPEAEENNFVERFLKQRAIDEAEASKAVQRPFGVEDFEDTTSQMVLKE